jgi:hypothetical protein
MRNITASNDTVLVVNTARPMEMKLFDRHHGSHVFPNQSNDGLVWEDSPKMGQFGVYDLILDPNGENRFEVALEPVPIYWCMRINNNVYLIVISCLKSYSYFGHCRDYCCILLAVQGH